jgi:hypothetical protein
MIKKKYKKLSSIALLLIVSSISFAQQFVVDGINYNILAGNTNVEVIANIPEYSGVVNIPSTVTYSSVTYSVSSIGSSTFSNCSGLTSVTIPNSVISIGDMAFNECGGLTTLSISTSLTSIGSSTFLYCSGLTSVTIPNSVTSIGESAFYGCSITSLTIPNSVTSIGVSAFGGCSGLTSVTIPTSVTSIGEAAFSGCSALTTVNVSWASPLVVPTDIFLNVTTTNLTLNVPSGKKDAYQANEVWGGFQILEACANTTSSITETVCGSYLFNGLNRTETGVYKDTLANAAGCDSIITLNLTIETPSIFMADGIKYYVNEGTSTVSVINKNPELYSGTVIIPSSVTYCNTTYSVTGIANSAFEFSEQLLSVTIPNSVTTIGVDGFASCTGLTSINIPNSVTFIGDRAFRNCGLLSSMTIPNSVISIGEEEVFRIMYLTVENANPISILNTSIGVPDGAILYVPKGAKAAYQAATGWNQYVNIVEPCSPNASTINKTSCNSYSFGDMDLTESGTYKDTIPNMAGCDSVITLNLTIKTIPLAPYVMEPNSVCDSGSFMLSAVPSNGRFQGCRECEDDNIYLWKNADGDSVYNDADFQTPMLYNYTYYIVTAANECGVSSPISVNIPINKVDLPTLSSNPICKGNTAEITASYLSPTRLANARKSEFTPEFVWFNANMDSLATTDVYVTENLIESTDYFVKVKMFGCESAKNSTTVYVNQVDTAVSISNGTITANIADQEYQWINADTKTVIENETTQDFMPNVSGNYAVIINQFFGKGNFCSDTSGARFVEVVATGLETSTVSNFTIYPNPASDNVTITLTESASGTVSIVDLHGNAIATKSISGNTSNISTADLASGVYVVKISSDKGVAVKQLIVQ